MPALKRQLQAPVVVHVHEPFDVYIGRAVPRAKEVRAREGSIWGNPFIAQPRGQVKVYERTAAEALRMFTDKAARLGYDEGVRVWVPNVETALEAFETLMRRRLFHSADWRASLRALGGKRLACWCSPGPCHGDVLVKLWGEGKEKQLGSAAEKQ